MGGPVAVQWKMLDRLNEKDRLVGVIRNEVSAEFRRTSEVQSDGTTKLTGGNEAQRNCRPVQRLIAQRMFLSMGRRAGPLARFVPLSEGW